MLWTLWTLRHPPPAFALNPSSWPRITMLSQTDPSLWAIVTRLKKKRSEPHSSVVLQQIQISVRTPSPPPSTPQYHKCTCTYKHKTPAAIHTANRKHSKITPSLHCRNSKCTDVQLKQEINNIKPQWTWGPWWRSGYGTALQIGWSLVWFLLVSMEIFIDIILPNALWPWNQLSL